MLDGQQDSPYTKAVELGMWTLGFQSLNKDESRWEEGPREIAMTLDSNDATERGDSAPMLIG
jgi:hypothetical protein